MPEFRGKSNNVVNFPLQPGNLKCNGGLSGFRLDELFVFYLFLVPNLSNIKSGRNFLVCLWLGGRGQLITRNVSRCEAVS